MAVLSFIRACSLLLLRLYLLLLAFSVVVKGQPLVPAIFLFGDSVVDVGNNNDLHTVVKSDFPPYGRDFVDSRPTGRFCNGKLATDFTAESLGFSSYQPAYLSDEATGTNLLTGANFASASTGYYEGTAELYNTIPLSQQLGFFKEYQQKLEVIAGISNASSTITGGIYLISAGSSDFLQNYYINPLLYELYSPNEFAGILLQFFSDFVTDLYNVGARKIGVTSLPPLGCLPGAITLFGHGSNECVDRLNEDAVAFNNKLNATSQQLQQQLSNLTLVVFDIYQPLHDLATKPQDNGFAEARRACCGTGLGEISFLCNDESPGTCRNATEYVFWDGFHPSEAANKILSNDLLAAGISLIS
ncbi:hypothetical protein Nepgr_014491 [Nepenthes gracilis]|uniref:GDSL esterase/lipase n=1 Tax=Nepenthes gracilis TaxID=150966 RepID=A0AAD3SJ89_NEPGR|nr:hypothetical protein Nepgr_014491 [Nepenthes gracilis]